MTSRRKFIRQVSVTAASGALFSSLSAAADAAEQIQAKAPQGAIVLSTWAHGLPANAKTIEILKLGGRPLDAAVQGVMVVESDPLNTSVGLGGFPDRDGHVTLDACLMDELGNAGSVCFLEGIDHPISVARMVMEKTDHVMLAGEGALQFALQNGFQQRKGMSPAAKEAYVNWLKTSDYQPVISKENHDTIGLLVRDGQGSFSGACTTSGLAFKVHGRVGDSPIIGAGLFVDPEIGAATATGMGESVIKICGSHLIVELMRLGITPQKACEEAVKRITVKQKNYKEFQVGFLAINKNGDTGAFSIQPGFQYALAKDGKNDLIDASSLLHDFSKDKKD